MGISFTPSQQKVIDLHKRNILVSAAAGSGKTAVLVQRIIEMISNQKHPVDIDRLLIVTFTNAAAAEMRERISLAISKKLESEPDNSHLQRQATLIHNAQITTIDSFCLFVVRNHFDKIGIDPAFRAADEGEMTMLKKDVFESLMEENFDRADPDFLQMIECFASGKGEDSVEEMVMNLYQYAMSYPFPKRWLQNRKNDYAVTSEEELLRTEWMQLLVKEGKESIEEQLILLRQTLKITEEPDGPYMYGDMIESEIEMLEKCLKADSYQELETALAAVKFGKLPNKRDDSVSVEKRDAVKDIRGKVRDKCKELSEVSFAKPLSAILSDMQTMQPVAGKLVDLAIEFEERFSATKREKNLIDFHDMEHFALQILIRETEDGGYEPTAVAREYQAYFSEIMIDEYQDSNLVQETLLKSISKEEMGEYNRFMVGDVKQSIYRFRLSEPRLFMEKMERYSKDEEAKEVRIDLNQNFRSRREVLDSCNAVFEKVMCKELGGVPYEEEVRLNLGATYPQFEQDQTTEICVFSVKDPEADPEEEEQKKVKVDKKEMEATMIAGKILEMVGKYEVKDGEGKRTAKFSDIVILLRSLSDWEEPMRRVLTDHGIPVYVTSKTGYFSAVEVNTVLQLLLVLDNPRQDIALFVALHSPIFGFTEEELAQIKAGYEGDSTLLYDCLTYDTPGISEELQEKKERFFAFLHKYRKRAGYLSIHVLIDEILEETGYMDYVTALPAGAQRKANLEMLLEKATEFEKTSYRGLFRFVRYIEHLKEYEIDYGEAELSDETADAVRIMSIHKSKGLEFPICFVSGMGKKHNLRDTTKKLLMDMSLGIAVDYYHPAKRVMGNDLRKKVLAEQMKQESIGEELRVFYVAMTRAKEKLILTGYMDDFAKRMREIEQICQQTTEHEPYRKYQILEGKTYLDWVLMTLCADKEHFRLSVVTKKDLEKEEWSETVEDASLKARLTMRKDMDGADQELTAHLNQVFHYEYPYTNLETLFTKTTVTELKKAASIDLEEEEGNRMFEEPEKVSLVPKFMGREQPLAGNERGTAYHRVMELLDFRKDYTGEAVSAELEAFVSLKKMTEQQKNAIRVQKITEFMQTDMYKRMQRAAEQGLLYKEQPFVYGLSAKRLQEIFPEEETVLIQGIVDVFWEEDGELVILDYKTDALTRQEDFLKRYRIQLSYYAEALENITGKRVKETYIYSFKLGNSDGMIKVVL